MRQLRYLERSILVAVLIPLLLAGLAGSLTFESPMAHLLPSRSVAASPPPSFAIPAAQDLTPRIYIPVVIAPPRPPEFTLTIYDLDGQEQDWDWLVETFGAVTLDRGTGDPTVTVLRAIEGPMALVVRVENPDGDPLEGVPVMFWWPDAPELPPEKHACGKERGLEIATNAEGRAEFIMGGGAAYWPPEGGPHAAWIDTEGTDCLGGLGWVGETEHVHLNSEWTLH